MTHIRAKAEEDASLIQLGEDFSQARPLWNAEVVIILNHHLGRMKEEASSGSSSVSTNLVMLEETHKYVAGLNNYPNKESIDEAHELLKKYTSINDWEMAVLNNLRIDDFEECVTLIPTIKLKIDREQIDRESVEQLLADLKRYQTP